METKDSNVNLYDFLVIKPFGKYEETSERKLNETDLFEMTQDKTKFIVLEKKETNLNYLKNEKKNKQYNFYPPDMLLSKITLVNFPISTYIMQVNGQNAITAKRKSSDENYVFDIFNSDGSYLSIIRECSLGANESLFTGDRKKYLRTGRIDSFKFLSTQPIEGNYDIIIEGFVFDEDKKKWIEKKINYKFFYDENRLLLHFDTKELVFKSNENFELTFRLLNEVYGPFKSKNNFIKFYFDGFDFDFPKYLSSDKNKSSINFSRINNISFITNKKNIDVDQFIYVIKHVHSCENVFIC